MLDLVKLKMSLGGVFFLLFLASVWRSYPAGPYPNLFSNPVGQSYPLKHCILFLKKDFIQIMKKYYNNSSTLVVNIKKDSSNLRLLIESFFKNP